MNKKIKWIILISLSLCLLLFFNTNNVLAEDFDSEAEAVILVDYATGKILYEKNANDLLPPASMSKMITEYIILEAIENGELNWDTKTKISDYGHWISTNNDFSGITLNKDIEYSVKDLFQGLAVYSDNAAVITLLELIADSETEYIDLMAEKAKELGLTSSTFVNATGINNESLEGRHPKGTDSKATNQMTASDLAILGYRLITDYPEILEIANQPEIEFHGITLRNRNWMLKHDSPYLSRFYYEGIDGIKTGSSTEAGYSYTSTVERDGQRYLAVVMKTENEGDHFRETKKLYEYAYDNFIKEKINLNQIAEELPVEGGKKPNIKVNFKDEIELPIHKDVELDYEIDYQLNDDEEKIEAPIKKNEQLGVATIKSKDVEKYGYLLPELAKNQEVDVYAGETINKKSWLFNLKQAFFSLFS